MTAPLATLDDVAARMARPLTDQEATRAAGLIEEAQDLVTGYLRTTPDPHPTLALVVSRMAARVLELHTSAATAGAFGATTTSQQIGDYSTTHSYPAGTTSGGPWLSSTDKTMLRPFAGPGAFSIDTAPGFTPEPHTRTCALAYGADYCDCGVI